MTSRTSTPLVCECGHIGHLECRENDQPFSGLWEEYSLSGFDGDDLTISSATDLPESILAALKPTCPKCGQTGKVKYAPRT